MYYVYVLVEVETKKTYVGFTKDLKQRVKQHQEGKGAKFTKTGNWKLAYYEAFASEQDARIRERRLKYEGRSKRQLYERIQNSLTGWK